MDENADLPPPSVDALMQDLRPEQVEVLYQYCEKHAIPIIDFIDQALLEAQWRYLYQQWLNAPERFTS